MQRLGFSTKEEIFNEVIFTDVFESTLPTGTYSMSFPGSTSSKNDSPAEWGTTGIGERWKREIERGGEGVLGLQRGHNLAIRVCLGQ